jgi:mRNA interferase RelE/StbE
VTTFRPEIPPYIAEIIRHLPPDIRRSLKAAIRALSNNPELGDPLIKELNGFWKYRVKRFRIIYAIERRRKILQIIAVGHRRGIYEEVSELIHKKP